MLTDSDVTILPSRLDGKSQAVVRNVWKCDRQPILHPTLGSNKSILWPVCVCLYRTDTFGYNCKCDL